MRFLACDPSINNIGWSIWDTELRKPILWGTYHTPKFTTEGKLHMISTYFHELCRLHDVDRVVVEQIPSYTRTGDSGKPLNRESMEKLAMAAGVLLGLLPDSVQVSKGNKCKIGTTRQTMLMYKLSGVISEHCRDSIYIGHKYLSKYLIQQAAQRSEKM